MSADRREIHDPRTTHCILRAAGAGPRACVARRRTTGLRPRLGLLRAPVARAKRWRNAEGRPSRTGPTRLQTADRVDAGYDDTPKPLVIRDECRRPSDDRTGKLHCIRLSQRCACPNRAVLPRCGKIERNHVNRSRRQQTRILLDQVRAFSTKRLGHEFTQSQRRRTTCSPRAACADISSRTFRPNTGCRSIR
jgi:hypothetical protein